MERKWRRRRRRERCRKRGGVWLPYGGARALF